MSSTRSAWGLFLVLLSREKGGGCKKYGVAILMSLRDAMLAHSAFSILLVILF